MENTKTITKWPRKLLLQNSTWFFKNQSDCWWEKFSDGKQIAETFNNYFNNAVKSLNLQCGTEHLNDFSDVNDPIEIAIIIFKNYPSILNINENIPKTTTLSFDEIEIDLIKKMIDNPDSRKSGTFGRIPANFWKVFQIPLSFYILFGMMKYSRI